MAWSLHTLPSLSEQQFSQWGKLLEERAGIQLARQQKPWLESQVVRRMRELGHSDYDGYYRYITQGLEGKLEWARLIDRVSVKETHFFRHRESIEYVRRYLQQRIATQQLNDSFEVWSIGCSTGEEPYSLAMAINDCFEQAERKPYYGITAMDISSSALACARSGQYHPRRTQQVSPEEAQRYLRKQADGSWQVVPELRERVCFTQGNIIHASRLPQVQVDVIFCQNLLVYFRRWLRRDVLNALVERLKPGGLLVVGLGETIDWQHPQMQRTADSQVQAYLRTEQNK